MIYFYIFIFFISTSLLEFKFFYNQLSQEFILSFLISLSYTHIYSLYSLYSDKENMYDYNPISLFIYFLIFNMFFYLFIGCGLLFYIQQFRGNNYYIYFIE